MAENQSLINLGSVQSPYLQREITIPAGGTEIFYYTYDSFNLLDANIPDILDVTFGGAAVQSKFAAGMAFKLSEPVSYIQFFNTGNAPLTIRFALAIGEILDNRLNISGTVLTRDQPFDTFTATTVAISSGQATFPVAAKTIIQNNGSNVMYIGGTGTDGLQLQPQGTFEFSCAAIITIFGTNGDNIAVGSFN